MSARGLIRNKNSRFLFRIFIDDFPFSRSRDSHQKLSQNSKNSFAPPAFGHSTIFIAKPLLIGH